MIASMHVVKQEHRLGQLLDGSSEIDPIEQPAQPQVDNARFRVPSSASHHRFSIGLSNESVACWFLRKLIKATLARRR